MLRSLEDKHTQSIIKEALLILIDDALDRNDRDKFLALSKELQDLSKKIG